MDMANCVKLSVGEFVQVYDKSTNITRLEIGPQNLVLEGNDQLLSEACPYIVIPPAHYCTVKHPLKHYSHRLKVELKLDHLDVRFHQDPFPLYPGEELVNAERFLQNKTFKTAIKPIPVIPPNHAIALRARFDFTDANGVARLADEEWHENGPMTYYPIPEAEMIGFVEPHIIHANEALRLEAKRGMVDKNGVTRYTGENWLIREVGAYVPLADENVCGSVKAITLTDTKAVHLRATCNLVDSFGTTRRSGEEWLVTNSDCESLIPEIGIEVVRMVDKTIVGVNSFCVIRNPVDSSMKNQLGKRELRIGVQSFFLQPGEEIEGFVKEQFVLGETEALKVKALDSFTEKVKGKKKSIVRRPGDTWLVKGPVSYIPPIEVDVISLCKTMCLMDNQGVYVQNIRTGAIRCVMGPQSYLLQAEEELFSKPVSSQMAQILKNGGGISLSKDKDIRKMAYFDQSIGQYEKDRRPYEVITYRCPHNTAVQVYDYQNRKARVIFGPELVILGPHEDFTILSLSAGKPKKADTLKTICLMLGPDFITDILEVETADHARLSIKLSFNNYFEYTPGDPESEEKIFSVNDFVGYACRQVGGAVRASVAQITFDAFHRNSSDIIHRAVFGDGGKLKFSANSLVISSIDLQSVEPVDSHMRQSLMHSIQQAIEIATKSVERSAEHEAARREQEARGLLDRQKLENEKLVEIERAKLLLLQAESAGVESTGQAKAESIANAERMMIEGLSTIELAKLAAQAKEIEYAAELASTRAAHEAEISYLREMANEEISHLNKKADIEVGTFRQMVECIGCDTIKAVAVSGEETKVRILQGLGITSTLITDGNSPINLFNTAEGLIRQK